MKHYLLALSIGTAFLVGCQSPQKQNLIDSNFAFAEQQLKYAFPKIDEARANESQESKEKRIAKKYTQEKMSEILGISLRQYIRSITKNIA